MAARCLARLAALILLAGDVFQAVITREGQVARKDARGTEDDDGVADALFFQLHVRMDVFGEDAQRASGSALQKFGIFVGRFGRVRGLSLGNRGDMTFSPNARYNISVEAGIGAATSAGSSASNPTVRL